MAVNASEKLTHSGKSSAPSLSLSAPELTSSGVLVGSALNTQSQTLTNSGLLQGRPHSPLTHRGLIISRTARCTVLQT